jgi:hypothetical protein
MLGANHVKIKIQTEKYYIFSRDYEEEFLKLTPDQQEAINAFVGIIMDGVKGVNPSIPLSHGGALELLCKVRDYTC